QNAFMLYRRIKSSEIKKKSAKDKKQKSVSKKVATLWEQESDEVKKVFYALQRIAEKKHNNTFKDYKFIRKTRKSKNQPKTQGTVNEEVSSRSSTPQIHAFQPSTTDSTLPNLRLDNELAPPYLQDNNPVSYSESQPSTISFGSSSTINSSNNRQDYVY